MIVPRPMVARGAPGARPPIEEAMDTASAPMASRIAHPRPGHPPFRERDFVQRRYAALGRSETGPFSSSSLEKPKSMVSTNPRTKVIAAVITANTKFEGSGPI